MSRVVIIGAGISGLATAYAVEQLAAQAGLDVDTLVVEKQERTGGKIWSRREEGYLCEWGPNGFLDNKPMTLELCESLGISEQLMRSDDNARKRFIYSETVLHRLPENGPSFLKSNLISWPGKLRLACEPLIPKRTDPSDETLAEFGRRRLGNEALNKLIAPMVSGIFAGDPETMSLKSCFKRIYELEQEYGGLIKAMIKLAKKKKQEIKEGKAVASAAGPGGILTSFQEGIQQLTDGVGEGLKGDVKLGNGVVEVESKKDGYLLTLENGEKIEAEILVSAVPAYAVAKMLDRMNGKAAGLLQDIPYATMNVICFGYERERISHDLNGFGYLIPKAEGRSTLGTLWDSSIFPNRAPEGHVLLRSMMGGATNMGAIDFSDEEVIKKTKDDLWQIMGISAKPEFVRIFRHPNAIPQYTRGHAARVEAIESALQNESGLFLTGNAFAGVGLNDCVNASNLTAQKVITELQNRT
ncbi:protoporphyrinogen oxidase [Malonomonas rubra DSM 5091]|uniref:Coproporphyrinogen III oxidase n=1 Tax=Malonomonas rubra DSM 5091 TaxID=1122189 RepID=A0A1M6NRZ4_MALRU|nr:protoporphyrinogen oxidase [Malonomonas rubra]SHJ98501.1 protoporphyrinogen oxidase [Malonomonas rubra DSM 5091]